MEKRIRLSEFPERLQKPVIEMADPCASMVKGKNGKRRIVRMRASEKEVADKGAGKQESGIKQKKPCDDPEEKPAHNRILRRLLPLGMW